MCLCWANNLFVVVVFLMISVEGFWWLCRSQLINMVFVIEMQPHKGFNLFWMNSGTSSSFKSHRKGDNWNRAWKKWDYILRELFYSRYSIYLSDDISKVEITFKLLGRVHGYVANSNICESILITGPTGEIISAADDKEEALLLAEFDLDKIKSKRKSWGVFRDRRPELYKVLLTLDGNSPTLWDHHVSVLFVR